MCAAAIGEPHQHVVDLDSRALMCTCRPCYLLFTDDRATLRYRAVPDRYLSFPDLSVDGRAWDELQIPVGLAFLFHNSVLGPDGRVLPGPGRRHRVRAAARRLGPDRRGQPAARRCCAATSRRCWSARGRRRLRAATWCRSTPATSWSAGCGTLWRGFDGGHEAPRPRSTPSSPRRRRSRPSRRADDERPAPFTVLDVVAEPYAAAPQLTARLRIAETTGAAGARDRAALPGPDRAAAPPLRPSDEQDGAARPVRRAATGGRDTLQAVPVDAVQRHGAGLHRQHRGRPARCPAPTTSTSIGSPLPARARRRRRPAGPAVLRHRLHPGRAAASGSSRCRGTARRATRCRSRCGGEMMAAYFPSTGWLRLDRDVLDRARRLPRPARPDQLGRDRAAAARPRPRRR